jgi:peptide/nickel transport system ATP-binding protein
LIARRTVAVRADEHVSQDGHPLLEVRDLVTQFATPAGPLRAVDGVSLSLERGRTLGIVGESGSGKTVLARSLMGLLPREGVTRQGEVRLNGRDLMALSDEELRDVWGVDVAMVFQNPMTSLNPVRRIGQQMASPLRRHLRLSKREARQRALELLRAVGIPDAEGRLDAYPHELSGGMRQRVMIAIAIACKPSLLLADEPTTALDVTVQKQVLELLDREQAELSMAMILVTHDLGVVSAHSDHVAVMYAGKVVERAPTRALFDAMKMPYTEALFRSIPRLEDKSHTPLPVIPGRPPDLVNRPVGCSFAPRCSYAQDRCREEEPPLRRLDGSVVHEVACWYPIETPVQIASPGVPMEPNPS